MKEIEITLNPAISPQQNAAKFYKDYQKAKNAEKILTEQIAKGEQELAYLGKRPRRAHARGIRAGSAGDPG